VIRLTVIERAVIERAVIEPTVMQRTVITGQSTGQPGDQVRRGRESPKAG
jgi:hypothetical protein